MPYDPGKTPRWARVLLVLLAVGVAGAVLWMALADRVEERLQEELDARIRPHIEAKRAEVEEHARQELREELNVQSRKLLGLMLRYSTALQRLALAITASMAEAVYIHYDPRTNHISVRWDAFRDDLGLDITEKVQARLRRASAIGDAVYQGGRQDLAELGECRDPGSEACEVTPDHILEGLLALEPGNEELLAIETEFEAIRQEVRAMLSEGYWMDIADQRTRNVIEKSFGL